MGRAIDVVKRGGKRPTEAFDRNKLHASIYAACRSVRSLDGLADEWRRTGADRDRCDDESVWNLQQALNYLIS